MTRLGLLVLGAVLALAAGCGAGAGPSDDGTTPAPTTDLQIRAKNVKFDRKVLAAVANSDVQVTLVNDDRGVLHNIAFYMDKSAREKIFVGPAFTGRKTETSSFKTPAAGTYYFRCDIHPDMNGRFEVL